MATTQRTADAATTDEFTIDWQRLDDVIGFPLKVLPLVTVLGVLVAMASVPQFFRVISDRFGSPTSTLSSWLDSALSWLADVAETVSSWLSNPVVVDHLGTITKFALISVLCLLPAALIRSMRASSWMPIALTSSGLLAGFVAVPLTIWLGIASWYLFRLIVWLFHIAHTIVTWIASALIWLAPVFAVLLAVALIGWVIYWFVKSEGWPRLAVAGAAALLVVGWFTGLLDPLLRFLKMLLWWLTVALAWVASVLTYVVIAVIAVAGVLLLLGAVVALFGSIGRVSLLSVTGAWESSRGAQKVTDLSAGVGLTIGLITLGSVYQEGPGQFGSWLESVWTATPIVRFVPPPVSLMGLPGPGNR